MKKVAIFGKPGSGKSQFARQLARLTGLPLTQLDRVEYQADGKPVPRDVYLSTHSQIVESNQWILDGFGLLGSFKQRLELADTLIYIDLPYWLSYWLVTKRLLKGIFIQPEGWPDGSSVIKGTVNSYKTLRKCPQFWNQSFYRQLMAFEADKQVIVIRSLRDMKKMLKQLESNKSLGQQ